MLDGLARSSGPVLLPAELSVLSGVAGATARATPLAALAAAKGEASGFAENGRVGVDCTALRPCLSGINEAGGVDMTSTKRASSGQLLQLRRPAGDAMPTYMMRCCDADMVV